MMALSPGRAILRDVLRLVSGTLAGRLIAIAVLPMLTRLYEPQDFAMLAVYLALVGMVAVVAGLRLDIAIPMAQDDSEAAHLLVLALASALAVALLVALVVLLLSGPASRLLGRPDLAPFLWLVPLGGLAAAVYSALQFHMTRMRRFGVIALTRVTQAVSGAAVMLSLGWAGIAPLGLLLGNMINLGAGSLRLARELWRHEHGLVARIHPAGLRAALRRNRRFPIFSAPEALANIAGIQLPVLVIAAHAGAEAGHLLLAMQIMALPMGLLGQSVSQVYVSRAREALHEGSLAALTAGVLRRLMQIGILPLMLGGLAAPLVFPWIFGPSWARAGEIVAWMVPWTVLQFLASPLSMVLHVTGRQNQAMLLQFAGLALRLGPVLLLLGPGSVLPAIWGAPGPVAGMILGSAVFYAAYLALVLRAAGLSAFSASGGMVMLTGLLLVGYSLALWVLLPQMPL